MEQRKPVELWKGIVGTAVSGFILLVCFCVFLPLYLTAKELPIWVSVWFLIVAIISLISLMLSLTNLREAIIYRKQVNAMKKNDSNSSKDDEAKNELLHRLLAEGKITIEEYDQLKK